MYSEKACEESEREREREYGEEINLVSIKILNVRTDRSEYFQQIRRRIKKTPKRERRKGKNRNKWELNYFF